MGQVCQDPPPPSQYHVTKPCSTGGIMKCDVIAQGIVNAAAGLKLQVPLVVRLEGTNVERGKEILKTSKMDIITADDLDDAASKAVKSIQS